MRLEQTTGEFREFCERLFNVVQDLAGKPPELLPDGDWYRASAGGRDFVRLQLTEPGLKQRGQVAFSNRRDMRQRL
jgi:hypothetical protein